MSDLAYDTKNNPRNNFKKCFTKSEKLDGR